jgi:hypothetical protein
MNPPIKVKRYNVSIYRGMVCADEDKDGRYVLYEDMVEEIWRQVELAKEEMKEDYLLIPTKD